MASMGTRDYVAAVGTVPVAAAQLHAVAAEWATRVNLDGQMSSVGATPDAEENSCRALNGPAKIAPRRGF